MRRIILIALINFILFLNTGGQSQEEYKDFAHVYFSEIKEAATKHVDLWDMNLYAPLLLVDPATRRVYANYPDSAGFLKK